MPTVPSPASRDAIAGYSAHLRRRRTAAATVELTISALGYLALRHELLEVTADELDAHVRDRTRTPRQAAAMAVRLAGFYRWARRAELRPDDPSRAVLRRVLHDERLMRRPPEHDDPPDTSD